MFTLTTSLSDSCFISTSVSCYYLLIIFFQRCFWYFFSRLINFFQFALFSSTLKHFHNYVFNMIVCHCLAVCLSVPLPPPPLSLCLFVFYTFSIYLPLCLSLSLHLPIDIFMSQHLSLPPVSFIMLDTIMYLYLPVSICRFFTLFSSLRKPPTIIALSIL